jgi:hypothetical protein
VDLAGALTVSGFMCVSWHSMIEPSVALVTSGAAGLVYSLVVIRRIGRQRGYAPVWQDWVWYAALPCAGYALPTIAAILLPLNRQLGLFGVAAAAVSLLLVGIHNAWDTVTHVVVTDQATERKWQASGRRRHRSR